jgi:2-polyprenyl-3-methyl-5-hydroxy-6-metoxy-1,4-benzoquinol methylase
MKRKQIANHIRSIIARIIGRDIVFLSRKGKGVICDVSRNHALLPLRYTYRSSSEGVIRYDFLSAGTNLRYVLYTMAFSGREPVIGQPCISVEVPSIKPGDTLQVNLVTQAVSLNNEVLDCIHHDCKSSRKVIAQLRLSVGRHSLGRVCSHYLPYEGKAIGKDYYFGDDYTDYPLHTNASYALELVSQYCSGVRLLDVGCALGIYTSAFLNAGFDAYGVDVSEFAVHEAGKRMPPNRVRQCNLDESEIPFDASFGAFWMWDVLEHSGDPEMMLRKISRKALQGSYLFLRTSNAESLTRRLFESDWEGYTDYSHHGVDKVSAKSLPVWLRDLGWEIVEWKCSTIWVFGNDPVVLRLHEVFENISELEVLLAERDLGDSILVVARKG